jgi:RNA polymerase sigma-70 factor (ECF subfamily)
VEEFEQIVRDYQKRVYNICLRLCGDPDDAFDLSQEAFLKAWRSFEQFRGDSAVYTWLYRLTVNACTDFLRKKARRGRAVSLGETECPLPDTRFEPSVALERKELTAALDAALGKLSPEHRQVVVLRETAGLSYGEIAVLLKVEEGTVKSRLARARLKLREIITTDGNDRPRKTSYTHEIDVKGGGWNGRL